MTIPVVVEILDAHGRVRGRERLALAEEHPRFSIGRGVAATVSIDDPHAAALHAEVEITPAGGVLVSDLGSLNGIVLGERREHGVTGLAVADGCFTIGRTRLRVRTAAETLAPELAEDGAASRELRNAPWLALGGALLSLLFVGHATWLGAPQDAAVAIATGLISALILSGVWIAAWGFVARVTLGEWRWLRHAAIFFSAFALLMVVDWALDLFWFALALPSWTPGEALVLLAFAAGVLYQHLRSASHISVRRAALVALLLPVAIGGSSLLAYAHHQGRDVNHVEAPPQLFPPSWRLRDGGTLDAYFADAGALKEEADQRRRAMPGEDGEEADAD